MEEIMNSVWFKIHLVTSDIQSNYLISEQNIYSTMKVLEEFGSCFATIMNKVQLNITTFDAFLSRIVKAYFSYLNSIDIDIGWRLGRYVGIHGLHHTKHYLHIPSLDHLGRFIITVPQALPLPDLGQSLSKIIFRTGLLREMFENVLMGHPHPLFEYFQTSIQVDNK